MVGRCIPERIVEATAIPVRRVRKSVEIFFDVNWFEDESSVPNRLGVFDQNSGRPIDAPHLESRIQKSTGREHLFQPFHRMETIDGH